MFIIMERKYSASVIIGLRCLADATGDELSDDIDNEIWKFINNHGME